MALFAKSSSTGTSVAEAVPARQPLDRRIVAWTDMVRGDSHVDCASLSDPVLVREDGTYLYTLYTVPNDGQPVYPGDVDEDSPTCGRVTAVIRPYGSNVRRGPASTTGTPASSMRCLISGTAVSAQKYSTSTATHPP